MQLVLGLGNPGPRYALTRHNVGYRCVETLANSLGLLFNEPQPLYRAAVGVGPGGPLTLVQPLTYMNRSGDALAAWARRAGYLISLPPASSPDALPGDARDIDLERESSEPRPLVPVVVCDDLNLELGSLRIRGRGSDGGQKGLASVLRTVGSCDVPRLRLGIGTRGRTVEAVDWSAYVLQKFDESERKTVDEMIQLGAEALHCLLAHGWEFAASRYNRRGKAPGEEI